MSEYVPISDKKSIMGLFVRKDSVKPADLIVHPCLEKSGIAPESADIRLYSTFSEYIDNEPVRIENNRIRVGFENDLPAPGEPTFVSIGYCCACWHGMFETFVCITYMPLSNILEVNQFQTDAKRLYVKSDS